MVDEKEIEGALVMLEKQGSEKEVGSREKLLYQTRSQNSNYICLKRIVDVIGSIVGLALFGIAFIGLFIMYKFGENKGPVLFKQKRIGKNGEIFYIYKFRSMRVGADELLRKDKFLYQKYIENGYKLEAEEDPRITKLGKLIRKTSIDELPQFINVLTGEMSLVGPRPIVLEELEEYGTNKDKFLSMKPGITGVWQTSGRSNIGYPERTNLELSYLENQGIKEDFIILLKTIFKVFLNEGAY